MKLPPKCQFLYSLLFFVLFLFQYCNPVKSSEEKETKPHSEFFTLEDFETVKKYDVHVHLRKDFDTLFISQAEKDNFGLLNVSVYTQSGTPPEEQEAFSVSLLERFRGTIAFATAFSLENYNAPEWEEETLAFLKNSFSRGAIAVKVWKNIGMGLKDEEGHLVMIDNSRFDPILDFIEEQNVTLIGHLGEPKNTWLPLEEMTVQGDKD